MEVYVESMDEAKDKTNNQRHGVQSSLIEIQKVLPIKRKDEEWELACDYEIDIGGKCI